MDPLTDILRLLRPRTVLLGSMVGAGNWAVRLPVQANPAFYVVTEGRCWYTPAGDAPIELQPGDYVLSAQPGGDVFASAPGVGPALSDDAFKASHTVDGEFRVGEPGARPVTRTLGGLIVCDPANAGLLLELLPRVSLVWADQDAGGRLGALIALLWQEGDADRPGRDAVLARLIEVILIETLRLAPSNPFMQAGVLRGLADPRLARALAVMHGDVTRAWTLATLARQAGLSRSVFARRFVEAVGTSPVDYLLGWRMALAREALLEGRFTLDEIAARVGYQSASAFSTAFSRRMGCAPRAFAAREAAYRG